MWHSSFSIDSDGAGVRELSRGEGFGGARGCACCRWVQSGDIGPHGLARGRRKEEESHSWQTDMHTVGREMNRLVRWTIEDRGSDRRRRVAERRELRGFGAGGGSTKPPKCRAAACGQVGESIEYNPARRDPGLRTGWRVAGLRMDEALRWWRRRRGG